MSWESEVKFTFPLLIHEVDFKDNLVDPLTSIDSSYHFFSADSQAAFSLIANQGERLTFSIKVVLCGELIVESRSRYNFWDLLGDVGGFYDGLLILATLIMSFGSRSSFLKDYLNGKLVDEPTKNRTKTVSNQSKIKAILESIDDGNQLERKQIKLISWLIS